MSRLIIVSNRLPISVKKIDGKLEYAPSIGGLATALASYTENGANKWIGWPGIPTEDITEDERAEITRYLRKKNCYPVFLSQAQLDGFYSGYSNGVLWPVFHHLGMGEGQTEKNWATFREVNQLYTDETLKLSNASDNIWVHDYQMLLMPEMLRIARPKASIGFFLHIPWPSAKDFSEIKHGDALLRGVLGADLVGTHTTAYANNFLDCCNQAYIGIVAPRKVVLPDRVVRVTDFPIGIDYNKFAEAAKSADVTKEYAKLRWKYRGQKVILTIDRLDPTKGLVERLKAYQTLLAENPALHRRVVMVMQAMPSRTEIKAYQNLRQNVDKLIQEINGTYGTGSWEPVEPIFSPLPFAQYAALYQRADVAFIAPIRDGMNLVAKEYLASLPKGDGVLVLSETAGAAEELKEAVMVNPAKPRSMVNGLKKALVMKPNELKERTLKMQKHLKRHTVDKWAQNFIDSMDAPLPKPKLHLTRNLMGGAERALIADYHQARRRLILLDYDGTLQPIVKNPDDAAPSKQTISALKRLGEDKHNDLYVISGRNRETLDKWLGGLPVNFVAEHGAYIRKPHYKDWHKTIFHDDEWKTTVGQLFEYYTRQTPGAQVEYKDQAVVWHYRNASPFHAQKNLVSLKRLMKPIAKQYSLGVKDGKMILEVHHLDLSKGHVTREWLIKDHDFMMAIGDDTTDEDMFMVMPHAAYTVKVGPGRTNALWRLPTPESVHKLLRKL